MNHAPPRRLLLLAMALATASVRSEASPGAGGRGGGGDMSSSADSRRAQDQDGVIFDKRDFAYCNRCVVRLRGRGELGGLRVYGMEERLGVVFVAWVWGCWWA